MTILGLACLSAGTASAANLIVNPGFETCNLAFVPFNWTYVPGTFVGCENRQHSGTFDADFAGSGNILSQSISTTIGDQYDFQFWLKTTAVSSESFSALFGGVTVFSQTSALPSYTLEDFTVMATSTTTSVAFHATTNGGEWSLDDVSVTDLGPVPEPSTLLLATGGLGIAFFKFRRKRIQ